MRSMFGLLAATALAGAAFAQELEYPVSKTVDQVDTYGKVKVEDPYRWLEDDVRNSEAVADWVEAQNKTTFAYLETLPGREAIEARLKKLWNYERFGLPTAREGRYFFSRNDGLQNQSVYYVQDGLDGEPRVLIDPNGWSEDGATALAGASISPDGSKVAYLIQDGGSDWRTVRVLDVATGDVLADKIEWVKFSGLSWKKDGSGFFYSRFPEPEEGAEFQSLNFNQSIYFHALGRDQSEDTQVYARPDNPEHNMGGFVTDDGRYLVITASIGTDNRYEVLIKDLKSDAEPELIFGNFENDYSYVGNLGEKFIFFTDRDAPRGRLIAVDIANPAEEAWTELVPQTEATLRGAGHVGGKLILSYLEDAKTVVKVFTTDGDFVRDVDLPGVGSAGGFGGEPDDPETFYSFSSFNQPPTLYRYNISTGESTVFKETETLFNPDDYVVSQEFYESTGGVKVPMFIVHRKDVEPNGDAPTLLYGYGGFNISLTPGFSVSRLTWVDMGGVFAMANLRGGGEYGKAWHDGGRLKNKQNVFDDFINAAEHLIEMGWTSKDNIAVQGGSNGGLLVGAVVNQRPDLFAAALPAVGVMDMLRYNQFTAGRYWVDDYGDPADPEMFKVLRGYSPYHNLEEKEYPAVLVTTADTDDRVVPGHSFKYTARLQEVQQGDAPTLIRIETRAGHGAGKPTDKIIEETADEWAFIAKHTGLDLSDLNSGGGGATGGYE